ncbi:hypothetical protein [Leucobacter sp. wl10]|uniref:hypothetical protein n=1 Tax=Leucobacter sp. wl10 TaxID=2304677 RepID=UPI000E5B17FB|nr:hypothetical protein [Leucobacter sp. wl10]RGE17942.1 hypothetical protein D1J51_15405 [Leucobacter sp. wl10]
MQVQRAFPEAQHLVSLQLLRNPLLRMFFTGIPVVRPQDVERYGMDPAGAADPVSAGARRLENGQRVRIDGTRGAVTPLQP